MSRQQTTRTSYWQPDIRMTVEKSVTVQKEQRIEGATVKENVQSRINAKKEKIMLITSKEEGWNCVRGAI